MNVLIVPDVIPSTLFRSYWILSVFIILCLLLISTLIVPFDRREVKGIPLTVLLCLILHLICWRHTHTSIIIPPHFHSLQYSSTVTSFNCSVVPYIFTEFTRIYFNYPIHLARSGQTTTTTAGSTEGTWRLPLISQPHRKWVMPN